MPHRSRLVTLVLAASLAGAAPASAAEFVPGEVIVHHEGETAPEIVSLDAGETVPEAVADLEAAPGVDYAVPNYKARASVIWNDPGRSGEPEGWTNLQWNFIGDASINAPDAWDLAAALGAPGGRGVVVAVVDTGAAYKTRGRFKRAPDLRRSTFVRGYDFVDRDRRPHDEFGHGTHVSGTIAQRVNNGIGVTGLAYNAKIMPVRVLDENGEGGAYEIARGIRYAAKHGADVVNLSLEFDPSITARQVPGIIRAIRFAHRKGAVVVAAAGNESDASVAYPARAPLRDLGRRDHRAPLPGGLLELRQRPRRGRAGWRERRRERRQPARRAVLPPGPHRARHLPADLHAQPAPVRTAGRIPGHVDGRPARLGDGGAHHRHRARSARTRSRVASPSTCGARHATSGRTGTTPATGTA